MTREEMLTHVALHGGYHRGEVGRILWQLSITPPWDTFAVYLHQIEPERRQLAVRFGVRVVTSLVSTPWAVNSRAVAMLRRTVSRRFSFREARCQG